MDIPLQHQSQPSSIYSPQFQPTLNDGTKATYQAKKISEFKGEPQSLKENKKSLGKRAWSSIKSIPRSISIFCRAVCKAVILGYYLIKYKVFKSQLTPDLFQSHIQTLGPVAAKLLQGGAINEMAKSLGTSDADKERFSKVLREFLDENHPMSNDEAHKILRQSFGENYSITKHIGTGTIASCFEVEKEGMPYVAKVVPSRKADQIAVGVKSLKMMTWLLPKWITGYMRDVIDPFQGECSLLEEQGYLIKFKEALAKNPTCEAVQFSGNQATVSFGIPSITEQPDEDNVLVMEKVEGGITLNKLLSDTEEAKSDRASQFLHCFGRQPVNDQECLGLIKQVHLSLKHKWRELASTHGLVHGDFHAGNLMLTFHPGGHVGAWILDLGNCLDLSDQEQAKISEMRRLVTSTLANKMDETDDFQHDHNLRNLVTFLRDQMPAKSGKKFDQKSEETLLKTLGKEFKSPGVIYRWNLEDNEKYKKDGSGKWHQEIKEPSIAFFAACLLAKKEGINLPPYFNRYAFALMRGHLPLNDEDAMPKPFVKAPSRTRGFGRVG